MDLKTRLRIEEWRRFADLSAFDERELEEAFYTTLTFGTGGLRGIMGLGSNRMNHHTVAFATQGLANYLKKGSVFIGYDTRHHSREFARNAAQVLSGNGIQVYLNREVCPTPLASFSCRYYQCRAAIMITASHNPPAYNGYKVFGGDGAQILPPYDCHLMDEMAKITTPSQVKRGEEHIALTGEENLKAYLESMDRLKLLPKEKSTLKIVYTNLHGTGLNPTLALLKRWGLDQITLVDQQTSYDGDFPTVQVPNPEDPTTLTLGVQTLRETGGDILIAQDPDADRMRAVLLHQGEPVYLTGNQIAALLLNHIVSHAKLPPNGACIKTIVTTELLKKIAAAHALQCVDVLTGFKYIAQKIDEWEKSKEYTFVFGGEESYGSLYGTFCRDKDAVMGAALIAEAAHQAKKEGKTLWDRYVEITQKYGPSTEYIHSIPFPETKPGRQAMEHWMHRLRHSPPPRYVVQFHDYLNHPPFPKSDVLEFLFEDGTKLIVRPSGTEPKIKIYSEGKSLQACQSHVANLLPR